MTLVKCPECGTEVSDKAIACVKCGYPISYPTPSDPEPSQGGLATASVKDSGGDAPSPTQESAEFQLKDGGMLVIQQRLVIDGDRIHRIAEIKSAEKSIDVKEPDKFWVGFFIFIGAMIVLSSVKSFFTGDFGIARLGGSENYLRLAFDVPIWGSVLLLVVGAIMVPAGIFEWRNRKTETFYYVQLAMSSGNFVLFKMQDEAQVDRVIAAIGEAMASEG